MNTKIKRLFSLKENTSALGASYINALRRVEEQVQAYRLLFGNP